MKKKLVTIKEFLYNVFKVKNITKEKNYSKLNITVNLSDKFFETDFMGTEPFVGDTNESRSKRIEYIKKTLKLYDDILKDKNKEWIKELQAMLLLKQNRHEDDVYLKGYISGFLKIDEWVEDLRAELDAERTEIKIQDGFSIN